MNKMTITAEDVKSVKGRGFLHNKWTDNFSARVVTLHGVVTAQQMKTLGEIAETFGNGTVTLTTRQSFELPGIPFAPPEGDAGTGMVATNSIEIGTGNVSAGRPSRPPGSGSAARVRR